MFGMFNPVRGTGSGNAAISSIGGFYKSDSGSVAFTVTGADTISVKGGTVVGTPHNVVSFGVDTAVTMPALTAGTDYAIYVCDDGSIRADASFTAPTGYTTANSRKIGGFHYAPGGNATPLTCAAVPAGTALPAETVTADKFALYALSTNAAGAITVTPAAGNVAGYATEAAALAAVPAPPSGHSPMGHITLKTKVGSPFVAGTDALFNGSSGNVASATSYYPAVGVALSRGTTDTNVANTEFVFYQGGNTTPAINPYSCWDLKWRPACPDPRGMALVAGGFWCDIYLLGVDHHINGTSKNGVTIADGASPPKIPPSLGGNGTKTYPDGNWWNLMEVLRSAGKRWLTYSEFSAAAYGVLEGTSRGNDPVSTGLGTTNAGTVSDQKFTSIWGVVQATGCLHSWGDEFGGGSAGASWAFNTQGRGATFQMENAAQFGGNWTDSSHSGSRCSVWSYSATLSSSGVSARGAADHVVLP